MNKDKNRIGSLKELLKSQRLDALVCVHPENVVLSTGMLPLAPFTVSILNKTGHISIICPWWQKESCELNSWADSVTGFDWLKNLKFVDPEMEILKSIKKIADKFKITKAAYISNFNCNMPSYTPSSSFSYNSFQKKINSIFDGAIDVSSDIHKLRAIKTDYEIKKIKKANLVAKEAAKAFYLNSKEGLREFDVAAEILKAVQLQAGKNGIKFTYCDPPQITSGAKRTLFANVLSCCATNKRLKKGELVMLELGGCADGYWFDLTRTLVVGGEGSAVQLDMVEALKRATKTVYKAYSDNVKESSELTNIAFKVLKESGFQNGIVHGLGHGVGFAYHEEVPGIGPGSTDMIEPGMVTSMEPGLYLPKIGGIRIEENVLWQENSVSVLSNFHSDLGHWTD